MVYVQLYRGGHATMGAHQHYVVLDAKASQQKITHSVSTTLSTFFKQSP